MNINSRTSVYAVLGYPVGHSKSPLIFNTAFRHDNINAVYLAFAQQDTRAALQAVRTLDIRGLSITIPHKTEAVTYMDSLDRTAAQLGSINTVINQNNRLTGYNYDGEGAVKPLADTIPDWSEKNILFIGNGGAARGIAMTMAVKYNIKKLLFLIRNLKKAVPLFRDLEKVSVQSQHALLSDADAVAALTEQSDIIINTTPVGMYPHSDKTPLPGTYISKNHYVYDIIYTPLVTRFLQEAREKGARTISGEQMFLGQAALQYELWLKKKPPYDIINKVFLDEIKKGAV